MSLSKGVVGSDSSRPRDSKTSGLDDTDRRILALLQKDGRLSNAKLAERLNLSETPCWRRLKRLEAEGYIEGYQARLNRQKLGLGVVGFAQVTFGDHSGQAPLEFEQKMAQMPEILSCHNVSGDCDYILQIVASDLEDYGDFVRNRLRVLPGITAIRSSLALREVKTGLQLPV
ncbi:Lrp/AsnC family transcriptional regulator [Oceanospirillum linum]|uniref:AsnC family transcriptional regulator n=1 Tax=Oceanospirillum linum TaxID=966 RepID=A0A1T1HDX0_OCELI|nr:Lrp/AsnC family transcriptional regulator [Oceanospirillum linum]OOV88015.1 AsnC family transcriptional regulator [Oceanospirillum linum]SEF40413.1 DNA-binding transcriptional regulator, Lrp family [Oleiphilus messinensis]SMP00457.1 transcriptional regulator, AsnC family [Oceanospirillum linum]